MSSQSMECACDLTKARKILLDWKMWCHPQLDEPIEKIEKILFQLGFTREEINL